MVYLLVVIRASDRNPLDTTVGLIAIVALFHPVVTLAVLQTETGLVTLCHSGMVHVDQIVVGENPHAVKVTETKQ